MYKKAVFLLLILAVALTNDAYAWNKYFKPTYQPIHSTWTDTFSNPTCGSSTCGYLLEPEIRHPAEPIYKPTIQNSYYSSTSSYDLYRQSNYSNSNFSTNQTTRFKPTYIPQNNNGGVRSNWDLYRGGK